MLVDIRLPTHSVAPIPASFAITPTVGIAVKRTSANIARWATTQSMAVAKRSRPIATCPVSSVKVRASAPSA